MSSTVPPTAQIASDAPDPNIGRVPRLRERVMRASAWRTGVYLIDRAASIATSIVLAQLLTDDDFGMVQLAGIFYQGLAMFSEVGIGPAIVNHKKDSDPDFLNTAWTVQLLRGIVLWVIAAAMAFPFTKLYGGPALLVWLIPAIGLNAAIAGFNSTATFTLNRQLLEGRRASLELAQCIIQRGSMIAIALVWQSPWAIVLGLSCGVTFNMIASHLALGGIRHRLRWHRPSLQVLFSFGKWVTVGTVIAFLSQQIDKLLIGKMIDIGTLGVYGIALTVARLPLEFAGMLTQHVLYPLLAEMARTEPARLRERLLAVRSVMLTLGLCATLGVILFSPWFFRFFYKAEFQAAAWMAPLAAATTWILFLEGTCSRALLAVGASKPLAIQGAVQVVMTAVACAAGMQMHSGAAGFIAGTAVGAAAGHLILLWQLAQRGLSVHRQDMAYTLLFVVLAGLGLGAPLALTHLIGDERGVWPGVALSSVVWLGTAVWAIRRTAPVLLKRR